MTSTTKVAVSLPRDTFDALERARRRLGRSRSGVVAEAIDKWLRAQSPSEEDRRYTEGYLRHPEALDVVGAFAEAAVEHWEPLDDQG